MRRIAALALVIAACDPRTLPSRGQALVVVDTDVPPSLVDRLRVDFYDDKGTWFDSRDVARPSANDWPASFTVYLPDGAPTRTVLVRLRGYPEGAVRDYLGERFTPREITTRALDPAVPPATNVPRLMRNGRDETPTTEPQPFQTIDRLIAIGLEPARVGTIPVVLHGACIGTMSDVATRKTCIDAAPLVAVTQVEPDPNAKLDPVEKSFGRASACPDDARPRAAGKASDGTPLFDEEACVAGGLTTLGGDNVRGYGPGNGVPVHVALLDPFYIDRYEVTVGRWRDAVARGFQSPSSPTAGSGQATRDTCRLDFAYATNLCTWTPAKGALEKYPLTCIGWEAARAFCKFEGGDLPTEAQWEWVAQGFGRERKSVYPWGDDLPDCSNGSDTAVFARLPLCNGGITGRSNCLPQICNSTSACNSMVGLSDRVGPQAVDLPTKDVSIALGIVGLGGNVAEMTSDGFVPLDAQCWAAADLRNPRCADRSVASVRGGSWSNAFPSLESGLRRAFDVSNNGVDFTTTQVGFRCARPL